MKVNLCLAAGDCPLIVLIYFYIFIDFFWIHGRVCVNSLHIHVDVYNQRGSMGKLDRARVL